MPYRVLFLAVVALLPLAVSAGADIITVRGRDKPLEGSVKSEDAKSVVVSVTVPKKKAVDETIPAADIIEIVYESISPGSLSVLGAPYRTAKDAEKESDNEEGAKRKAALNTAIANYNETLKKMTRDTTAQKYAARHLEYKVAVLTTRLATDQVSTDRGVMKLQEFAKSFPNSWQINLVMPLIAQIQMDNKEWTAAAKTFKDMSDLEALSADVRRDAELMVVTVTVRSGNIDAANKLLDGLDKKAGANPAFAARIKLARAEVLVGLKQYDKAIPILHEIVKTTSDKQTKAFAHNALGESLFKAGKYSEARWEFLWVDTIYNQDKSQHAKALYYLWKTFENLNEAERAQECREMLIGDRQFTGTEYQKLALSQVK